MMTSPREAWENPGSQRQMDRARDCTPAPNSKLGTGNKEIRADSQQPPTSFNQLSW